MCQSRTCLECRDEFSAQRPHAEFCCDKCRKTWNNRRATRGAELYDLFMAYRYQRKAAQLLGLWSLICRMAAHWNDEDKHAGRRTYIEPRAAMQRAVRYGSIVRRGR